MVAAATVFEGVVCFLHMNFRLINHAVIHSQTVTDRSAPSAPRPLGDSVAAYLFEVVEPLPRPRPPGFRQRDVRYVNARVVVRKDRGRGTGVLVHLSGCCGGDAASVWSWALPQLRRSPAHRVTFHAL